jgi:hypothetical protein
MNLATLFPMIISVLAMAFSVWLWLLQQQRERPRLGAHANRLVVYATDRNAKELPITVMNLSALPDVLFKVRIWGKFKDGGWLLAKTTETHDQARMAHRWLGVTPDDEARRTKLTVHSKLPINLAAHQTAILYLYVEFDRPTAELVDPFRYRVEMTGLGGRTHTCEIAKLPASG